MAPTEPVLLHRGRIELIGLFQSHRQGRSRFHIHGMFYLMRQKRAPILHLGDSRILFIRIHPVFMARFVLPRPIEAR
jgi:hypothetical protein